MKIRNLIIAGAALFMAAHPSLCSGESKVEAKKVVYGGGSDVDADSSLVIDESQGGLVAVLAAAGLQEPINKPALTYPALCIPEDWNSRYPDTVAPKLQYAFEIKVECGTGYKVGNTSHGFRYIIPITGGTFNGPGLKGKVLPGGADYQLIDTLRNRTELEAIYTIQTDDGVNIHVRNSGILCTGEGPFYFRTVPKFEAPYDSPYAWLNNAIFLCVPEGKDGYISLKMWRVE